MVARLPLRSVVTGGPGTGKSTLLAAAEASGMSVSPEVAREILQQRGGMELREQDPQGFADAMLEREIAAFHEAALPGTVTLFDRGFPDIAGFSELSGLAISPELDRACRHLRYEGPIFRTPPWSAIYTQDSERIQNWDDALASDAAVLNAWRRYGYDPIDLPLAPVEERLAFVRNRIAGRSHQNP